MCVGGETQRWRPHSDAPVSAFIPTYTPPPHVFFTFHRGAAASVCGQQPNAVRKRGQGLFKWMQKSASVKQPNFRFSLNDWWAARCDCGPLTHHFFINACLNYQPKPTRPRNPAGFSVRPGRRLLFQRQLGFQGKAAVCYANILFSSNKLNILMFCFLPQAFSPQPDHCTGGWQPGAAGPGTPCWGRWGRLQGPAEPCSSQACSSPQRSGGERCPDHHSCSTLGGQTRQAYIQTSQMVMKINTANGAQGSKSACCSKIRISGQSELDFSEWSKPTLWI